MNWPLGELKALATKAARGVGFSWSLAEEAGFATQWLDAHGVVGIAQIATYLQWVEANGLLDAPVDMIGGSPDPKSLKCPVALGCFIVDSELLLGDRELLVRQPALLLPFLGLTAAKKTMVCQLNGVSVKVCAAGIDRSALELPELKLEQATLSWQLTNDAIPSCVSKTRAMGGKLYVETLNRMASKTYAPATEASRLAGAGAGTTDND